MSDPGLRLPAPVCGHHGDLEGAFQIVGCSPQLLNQPILERQVSSFDPAFCSRCVSAESLDVELKQSASELRMALNILPRGFEVPERRLGTAEEHDH